jgi:acetyltransferase-like isoleucine patch superfamily enzyme
VATQIGPGRDVDIEQLIPSTTGLRRIERPTGVGPGVSLGRNVIIPHPEWVNLYGCTIGDNCKIGSFVEIQRGVVLGRNVKVQPFAFIPSGVIIEDGAFIGPHVCFTNDLFPSSVDEEGELLEAADWEIVPTIVKRHASIGANATIVCGVTIGEGALVGAGSVVTRDVPAHCVVRGNPARVAGARPRR